MVDASGGVIFLIQRPGGAAMHFFLHELATPTVQKLVSIQNCIVNREQRGSWNSHAKIRDGFSQEVGSRCPPIESTKYSQEQSQATTPIDYILLLMMTCGYTLWRATAIRRNRGPALSRRIGQQGSLFQHSQEWNPAGKTYGRFWIDVPGSKRKRRTIALGICRTPSIAKQKLREYLETMGVNSKQTFPSTTAPATTFRAQAEIWIASLSTRRRKPVKPATIWGWRHSLDKWLLPNQGDMILVDAANAALKSVIEKMAAAGLAPQSIVTHAKVVKMVVASAVNAEGEEIHLRKWNHNFVGMPIVDPTKQHRPTVTQAELQGILAAINTRYMVLVALLAGTGLRIGEALGLKVGDLTSDCRVLHVLRSIWNGREQQPKTENAVRVVDIPEQHATILREYVARKLATCFPRATARLCHKETFDEPCTQQVQRAVPFVPTVRGGNVAQSPCPGRLDWIVARARSKPYGQVCRSTERGC